MTSINDNIRQMKINGMSAASTPATKEKTLSHDSPHLPQQTYQPMKCLQRTPRKGGCTPHPGGCVLRPHVDLTPLRGRHHGRKQGTAAHLGCNLPGKSREGPSTTDPGGSRRVGKQVPAFSLCGFQPLVSQSVSQSVELLQKESIARRLPSAPGVPRKPQHP